MKRSNAMKRILIIGSAIGLSIIIGYLTGINHAQAEGTQVKQLGSLPGNVHLYRITDGNGDYIVAWAQSGIAICQAAK